MASQEDEFVVDVETLASDSVSQRIQSPGLLVLDSTKEETLKMDVAESRNIASDQDMTSPERSDLSNVEISQVSSSPAKHVVMVLLDSVKEETLQMDVAESRNIASGQDATSPERRDLSSVEMSQVPRSPTKHASMLVLDSIKEETLVVDVAESRNIASEKDTQIVMSQESRDLSNVETSQERTPPAKHDGMEGVHRGVVIPYDVKSFGSDIISSSAQQSMEEIDTENILEVLEVDNETSDDDINSVRTLEGELRNSSSFVEPEDQSGITEAQIATPGRRRSKRKPSTTTKLTAQSGRRARDESGITEAQKATPGRRQVKRKPSTTMKLTLQTGITEAHKATPGRRKPSIILKLTPQSERRAGKRKKKSVTYTKFQESFYCDFCTLGFSSKKHLKDHMKIHKHEGPYQCRFCEKTYTQLSHMTAHETIHGGTKNHECKLCEKTFSHSSFLKAHMRGHSRNYKCPECLRCFSKISHLRDHARTHTGEKPFSCDACGKSFTQSSVLKRHKTIHGKTKCFICEICTKTYLTQSRLTVHMRKHVAEGKTRDITVPEPTAIVKDGSTASCIEPNSAPN